MIKNIIAFVLITLLVTGCASSQEERFDKEIEGMYKVSISNVMEFVEIDQGGIGQQGVEKMVEICEDYIENIENFQSVEVPEEGENIYQRVNELVMELSDTLVLLSYSIEEGDTQAYSTYKEDLAFLFVEAGYVGEEVGEYLEQKDFVEEVMGEYTI